MKRLFLGVLFFPGLFGLAALAVETSPSDYVQEGLVAHWDAIDNVGTGTHDDAASIWKDLKSDRSFALTGGYSWGKNSLWLDGRSGTGGAFQDTGGLFDFTAENACRTVEIVFEFSTSMTIYTSGALLVDSRLSRIVRH